MKVKALWGFVGNAAKLGADSPDVRTGQEFAEVDAEYGHALVGKGLVEEVTGKAAPAPNSKKPTAPGETK